MTHKNQASFVVMLLMTCRTTKYISWLLVHFLKTCGFLKMKHTLLWFLQLIKVMTIFLSQLYFNINYLCLLIANCYHVTVQTVKWALVTIQFKAVLNIMMQSRSTSTHSCVCEMRWETFATCCSFTRLLFFAPKFNQTGLRLIFQFFISLNLTKHL